MKLRGSGRLKQSLVFSVFIFFFLELIDSRPCSEGGFGIRPLRKQSCRPTFKNCRLLVSAVISEHFSKSRMIISVVAAKIWYLDNVRFLLGHPVVSSKV